MSPCRNQRLEGRVTQALFIASLPSNNTCISVPPEIISRVFSQYSVGWGSVTHGVHSRVAVKDDAIPVS